MKKLLMSSFLAMGLSISAFAEQVPTPTMSGDNPALEYAGVQTCRINFSTGTNAVLCTSYPAIVYGVSTSSIGATDRLFIYSTNSLVLAGAVATKTQFNDNNQGDEDVTATQEYKFIAPIKVSKGLVIKASVAPALADWQEWIVYYREVK
jgi:hypothetical protein